MIGRNRWVVLLNCLLVALAGLLSARGSTAAVQRTFHVAPAGSDANPGTQSKPFATIEKARDAVREINRKMTGDIVVVLRAATYGIDRTIVFDHRDSGTAGHNVIYRSHPGKTAVISGGKRITGWKRGEADIWTAELPNVKRGNWYFRELFVNQRRAIRARTPNRNDPVPCLRLANAVLSDDRQHYQFTFPPGVVRQWRNLSDVEVVVISEWEIVRKRLLSVDVPGSSVMLAPPHILHHASIRPKRAAACHFENAPEMLDRPGEWYLDRKTGVLAYWPRVGEDMGSAEVVAPVLVRLVEVTGTAERPVRNLHFRGIQFAYTNWPLPKLGYFGLQACVYGKTDYQEAVRKWDPESRAQIDSAIRFRFAHHCSLVDGVIAHTGGCGLCLRKGCCDNLIEGNTIYDIGGNGVMVGEKTWRGHYYREPAFKVPPAEVPSRNRIANNHIRQCGASYHGGVGVWLAFTDGTVVSHNLVHDMPYTGVSVGWMWRPEPPTVCRNNIIEYNHIHDVMKMLADGGGIYTLGFQPGTVLRGNLIHDVHYSKVARQSPRSNNGMFLDNGSKGILVEGNIVYNTAGPPWRINTSNSKYEYMTWRNNYFAKRGQKLGPAGYRDLDQLPEALRQAAATAGLQPPYRQRLLGEKK